MPTVLPAVWGGGEKLRLEQLSCLPVQWLGQQCLGQWMHGNSEWVSGSVGQCVSASADSGSAAQRPDIETHQRTSGTVGQRGNKTYLPQTTVGKLVGQRVSRSDLPQPSAEHEYNHQDLGQGLPEGCPRR